MSESFPLISIELKVLKIVCIYWNSPCTELLDEEKESCRLSCFHLLSRNILFCFKLISSRKPTIGHKSELLLQSVIPVFWAHVKQWCLPREEYVSRLGGGLKWGMWGKDNDRGEKDMCILVFSAQQGDSYSKLTPHWLIPQPNLYTKTRCLYF